MGSSIDSRLKALETAIRRRLFNQGGPTDPLSQSLAEFDAVLLSLDEPGKALLLAELNQVDPETGIGLDLTMEDVERWIADWREGRRFIC